MDSNPNQSMNENENDNNNNNVDLTAPLLMSTNETNELIEQMRQQQHYEHEHEQQQQQPSQSAMASASSASNTDESESDRNNLTTYLFLEFYNKNLSNSLDVPNSPARVVPIAIHPSSATSSSGSSSSSSASSSSGSSSNEPVQFGSGPPSTTGAVLLGFSSSSSSPSSGPFLGGGSSPASSSILIHSTQQTMPTTANESSPAGTYGGFSSTVSLTAGAAADTSATAHAARPYWGDAFYSFQLVYWPIHCVICLAICTLGIFANVTNIIVLTRPNMITAVNTILSTMAFTDLIVNVSNIPYLIHELSDSTNYTSFYSFPWAVYILFHAHTTVTAHTISIWLTCVLATWRYFVVCRAQASNQRNWSVGLAKRAIACVFVLVPLFCVPNYLSFAIVSEITYSNNTIYKVGFSHLAEGSELIKTFHFWIFSCLTKLVPCVLLTFFTTVLIRKLLNARERRLRLAVYGSSANQHEIGHKEQLLDGTGGGGGGGGDHELGKLSIPNGDTGRHRANKNNNNNNNNNSNGNGNSKDHHCWARSTKAGSGETKIATAAGPIGDRLAADSFCSSTNHFGDPAADHQQHQQQQQQLGSTRQQQMLHTNSSSSGNQFKSMINQASPSSGGGGGQTDSRLELSSVGLVGSTCRPAKNHSGSSRVQTNNHQSGSSCGCTTEVDFLATSCASSISGSAEPGIGPGMLEGSSQISGITTSVDLPLPNLFSGGHYSQQTSNRNDNSTTTNNNNNNCSNNTSNQNKRTKIMSQLIVESSAGANNHHGATTTTTISLTTAPTKMLSSSHCDAAAAAESSHQQEQQQSLAAESARTQIGSSSKLDQQQQLQRPAPLGSYSSDCGGGGGGGSANPNNSNNNISSNNNNAGDESDTLSLMKNDNQHLFHAGETSQQLEHQQQQQQQQQRLYPMGASVSHTDLAKASDGGASRIGAAGAGGGADRSPLGRASGGANKPANNRRSLAAATSGSNLQVQVSNDQFNSEKRTRETILGNSNNNNSNNNVRGRSIGSTTLAPFQIVKLQAAQRQLNQNETTTRLLIAVMIVFLICEFPAGILAALCAILGQDFFENVYQPTGILTDLLALINSSVNFILYCFMSTQFRITFYRVVLHCPAPNVPPTNHHDQYEANKEARKQSGIRKETLQAPRDD